MTKPTWKIEFDEKFPAMHWFDCPDWGIDHEDASRIVKDFISTLLSTQRENIIKEQESWLATDKRFDSTKGRVIRNFLRGFREFNSMK